VTQTGTLAEAFEQICRIEAPLQVRLAAYADKLRELNLPFATAYDDLIARLTAGEVGKDAPAVGDIMPSFMLPTEPARLVSLEELTAKGPVVVSFDRGHWCPFCRIALKTVATFQQELDACSAQVVSIVPDRQEFAQTLKSDAFDGLLVLTDMDNGYALSLGLVMWLGDDIKTHMTARGFQLEAFHGNDGWCVPVPATFVVGRDGRVIARFVDPDFRKKMDIEAILEAVRSDPFRLG
jgi:peroxiredoxin